MQEQLNNLTSGYARLLIDDESYTAATTELLMEKKHLKSKKQQLEDDHGSFWFEPAKAVVETLELATKVQSGKSPIEVARLVRKIGTNHQISRKTVTFEFAEPYASTAQILALPATASADNQLSHDHSLHSRAVLCRLQDYLRTYFKGHYSS